MPPSFVKWLQLISVLIWSAIAWGDGKTEHDRLHAQAIPTEFESPFGIYPNILNVTESQRRSFHPVVVFPIADVLVKDWAEAKGLASTEEVNDAIERNRWWKKPPVLSLWRLRQLFLRRILQRLRFSRRSARVGTSKTDSNGEDGSSVDDPRWSIGKYDENRLSMYTSEMFDDLENTIDGYKGRRTVHLGIDLGAPAGEEVHAFWDGTVHSAG